MNNWKTTQTTTIHGLQCCSLKTWNIKTTLVITQCCCTPANSALRIFTLSGTSLVDCIFSAALRHGLPIEDLSATRASLPAPQVSSFVRDDEVWPFSFLDLSLETGNLTSSISNNFSAGSRSWDLNLADCLCAQRLQHRGIAGLQG